MEKYLEVTVIQEVNGVVTKTRLQGEDADKWARAVNSAIALDYAHGGRIPDVKWETINE